MKNMIKYIACAVVALGLAATVQAGTIAGGVTFNGDFSHNGIGADLSTATLVSITANANLSLSGSGTFAGVNMGNLYALLSNYYVSPAGGGALSPDGQVMWQILIGTTVYSFTVTTEFQQWNPSPNGGILNMSGAGVFSNDAGDPSVDGNWNFSWTANGAQFGFSGTDATNIPDGGLTIMLLGTALSGLALLRRKLA
jgi:hypothetical protein